MSTSSDARDSINVTALENLVYEAILSFGTRGCISDELRHMFPKLVYSSVTARFYNLVEKQKRVFRPGCARRGVSGRMQQVMWADAITPQLFIFDDPTGELNGHLTTLHHKLDIYLHELSRHLDKGQL